MKEFMCRHLRQIFIGWHADSGRVRVLHTSAACASTDVQYERVVIKRGTFHEPDFVLTNPLQIFFDLLFSPFVPVDYNRHTRQDSAQIEFLKFANFNWAVGKDVKR